MSSSAAPLAPGPHPAAPTILIAGAGRGLGHAMAEEFPGQGWNVIGTVRPGTRHSKLHELARTAAGRWRSIPWTSTSPRRSRPCAANVMLAQRGSPGLRYLDYRGHTVPW